MRGYTRHIRELLSGRKDSIDLFAAEDSGFAELCADFDACVDALDYWRQAPVAGAEARVCEYRELLEELFAEITRFLERKPDPRRLSPREGEQG